VFEVEEEEELLPVEQELLGKETLVVQLMHRQLIQLVAVEALVRLVLLPHQVQPVLGELE
jgi:hypothetical protein